MNIVDAMRFVDPPIYAEPCAGKCGGSTLEPDDWESYQHQGDYHYVCPYCRGELVMWAARTVAHRLDHPDHKLTESQRNNLAEAQAILNAVDQWI